MTKDELRNYYLELKNKDYNNKEIIKFINYHSEKQKFIVDNFNVNNIKIVPYNLPFPKLKFINTITSFVYKGKVGRKLDLLIYYDKILIGYIQYSSPVLNAKLNKFLKCKYGNYDFKLLNDKVVDVSVCVPIGYLRNYLSGKLCILVAMSKEIKGLFDQKYGTNVEIIYTTSIYGKSSMYNRIRNLKYLGLTEGYHSQLTEEQINEIKEKYKQYYPHRKIKKTALAEHIVRMYDHLIKDGIELSFTIPKIKKGVYVCDNIRSLSDNLNYWYERWFIGRRERIRKGEVKICY